MTGCGEGGGEVSLGDSLQTSNNTYNARYVLEMNGEHNREYHYVAIRGALPCRVHWALLIM